MKKKILAIAFAISAIFCGFKVYDDGDDFELIKNLEIFHTVMREIRLLYVDEPNSGELIKTAIDKMLESLDPYTVYYPESLVEDVKFINKGEYAGIGADMEKIGNEIIITAIYKDSPADKAGLTIGDKVTAINKKTTKDKSIDEISLLLKGEPGTNVTLTINHNAKNNDIIVKRAIIEIKDIPYYGVVEDKIGYINLSGFTEKSSKEFKNAFLELQNNKQIEKLIIDLRENPGGLLQEAVNIVNIFVNKGEKIVDMRSRLAQWSKIYYAKEQPLNTQIPIAVLVNNHSASAAEIVSGSLQDLDRAVILGEKTYGKGLVQSTRDLIYNAKFKITTAKYYIPSGRCIQKLDYSHKTNEGKATQIADSLIKTFKTSKGRIVKDAGGILPDILINADTLSHVVEHLIDNNIIFNYATLYKTKHSTIPEPEKFQISDNELVEFKKYADKNLYNYTTQADEDIKMLETSLDNELNSAEIKQQISMLKQSIQNKKKANANRYDNQIKTALGAEIVGRYYYDEGIIRYSLNRDPYIFKAISILKDENLYKKLLSGN